MKLAKARLKPTLRRLLTPQQPPSLRRSRQPASPYIFVQISAQQRKAEASETTQASLPVETEPSGGTLPGFKLRHVRKFWIRKTKTILKKPSATSSLSAELEHKRKLYERNLKIRSESPPCRGKPRRETTTLSSSSEQLEAGSLLLRPAKVFGLKKTVSG